MQLKLRPAYRNGYFIGFAYHQHSGRLQPVTMVRSCSQLMAEMGDAGLIDTAGIEEYVRTGGGPLQPRLDAIDQRQGRRR